MKKTMLVSALLVLIASVAWAAWTQVPAPNSGTATPVGEDGKPNGDPALPFHLDNSVPKKLVWGSRTLDQNGSGNAYSDGLQQPAPNPWRVVSFWEDENGVLWALETLYYSTVPATSVTKTYKIT